MTLKFWLIVGAVLLTLATGAAGAHWVDVKDYGHKLDLAAVALANEKDAHQQDLREVASAGATAAANALDYEKTLQDQMAADDTKHQQELQDAKNANDDLARAVSAGTKRLRIAVAANQAHSADGSNGVPGTTAAPGVDYDTVDLAPEARQAYYDLRESITDDQVKIAALQDYARACSAPPSK